MAIDEAQRQLSMKNFKISDLGDPSAANDVTKTDNTTAPANPAASAAAGSLFKAAPADHVHQGVHSVRGESNPNLYGDVQLVGASGLSVTQSGQVITLTAPGDSINKLQWVDDGQVSSVGTSEDIIREWDINFDDVDTGNIQFRLSGLAKVTAGTGTWRVYVGATAAGATAGGTVRATFTSTSTSFERKTNIGSAFANPTGQVIVQLTSVNSAGGNTNTGRGWSFSVG